MTELALPAQPPGLDWPTISWPKGRLSDPSGEFGRQAAALFDLPRESGFTYALIAIKSGELVYERYEFGASAMYLQYSWSMAKSVTHALVGILVGDGLLDLEAPAPVPEWQGTSDPRREITLDQLLKMRSGLKFSEDYVDGEVSDVIPMLSYAGRHDVGAFAAGMPLAHRPGAVFAYSSGTTNIICRIIRDIVGNGATGMLDFMRSRLLEPLGIRTAIPRLDDTGTFIGSSFLLATPQDFARFGYLYLRDGVWDGKRLLPEGWADHARTTSHDDGINAYGAHWWLTPGRTWFYASGYDGQRIYVIPEKDAVVVRCGRSPADHVEPVWRVTEAAIDLL